MAIAIEQFRLAEIGRMAALYEGLFVALIVLSLTLSASSSQVLQGDIDDLKSAVFLSPKFVLGPGSVENRYYYDIDFPKGHIAVKSFNAEVVDEAGNPIPLQETYLHHWVVARYRQSKDAKVAVRYSDRALHESGYFLVRNDGVCQNNVLGQYFGLGSETRKTATHVPDPYGIEVGNPTDIPAGYEEKWLLNVHAIDTRGVEDSLGCTECRCDLYNVTVDEHGRSLRPDYRGGLLCCYDHTQCRVRKGFKDVSRILYLRYTVKWVEWDTSIVPVKVYIFDVTDMMKISNDSRGQFSVDHDCHIEYEVEPCSTSSREGDCIDSKKTSLKMPTGGYLVYGVAHQHTGGVGAALYDKDGRIICSSFPTYGQGKEAGNEEGYIVGMSACYPKPGTQKLVKGETLYLESNYSSTQRHTGVMGLFYMLVAEQTPNSAMPLQVVHEMHRIVGVSTLVWPAALLGMLLAVGFLVRYVLKRDGEDGYEAKSLI